ncbi:DNA-binding protein [Flavilitoribacter nigricans DSM 23189 = NBRC 102662]|uniref:DNA-binding protein n=1 Tax=Flavilitoribacter nigricans (strain ATCC 23147 / DSM 23189 / NBRC 102662 / NCIMB 1420 / SS-2) TaxID=1122177 RepID=A0A2D0MYI2_FLAN2|nr:DNA-binding protein [Flavilitoribacter nigricans DSM 23189 = NBRC 102662]
MADFPTNVPVICVESRTFNALVKALAKEIRDDDLDPWIDEKESMRLLRITSKTTFQKYRDTGDIDFRRLSSKHIVYRRQSILDFIESSPKTKE